MSNNTNNPRESANEDGRVDDLRVVGEKALISPALLIDNLPTTPAVRKHIISGRKQVAEIVNGLDDRLLVIVGPCSIHNYQAAIDYATRLKVEAERLNKDLLIVMRVYFEKPRTTVGWKGFINDPDLDNTYAINKGLHLARSLLLEVNQMGLWAACELLDTISPQFFSDLVAWGAIGARTTESQIHRELASGMSMPVGFKNGTDGRVGIAIEAIQAAASPHSFLGVTKQGLSAIISTKGNPVCHVVLRGAQSGPNYESHYVNDAIDSLKKAKLQPRLMIDCSHGNSSKVARNQITVAQNIGQQLSGGSWYVMGVMVESNIAEGRQDLPPEGPKALKYGVSITDACISYDDTIKVLEGLAEAVRVRRKTATNQS